jgi:FKBP-type peptidyl-prolyl cis-trans isomerase
MFSAVSPEKNLVTYRNNLGSVQEKAFFINNAHQRGVFTLPNGLQYRLLGKGINASSPQSEDVVHIKYTARHLNGQSFSDNKHADVSLSLNLNQLMSVWRPIIQKMNPGSIVELYVPSRLMATSNSPVLNVPSNEPLIFRLMLLSFQKA